MFKHGFFPFHIVDYSPWPFYLSSSIFMIFFSSILSINHVSSFNLSAFIFFFLSFMGWMRDICNESFLQGNHTFMVQMGLKIGMVLFLTSEVFFFISFFWSLFYYSLCPSVEIFSWPPVGVSSLNPKNLPLLGTMILISSGISVTWSHHSIMECKKKTCMISLMITIFLGFFFSLLQLYEYKECSFTISDSVFGSIFFLSTGFHGIHVMIGTIMLLFCFFRLKKNHFSNTHHVGYEMSIWYWHFVDVIWLFLYIFLYWWSY